ncbi:gamma carbonic anhydrase family protein [Wenzhouxiangella marina]|uniref:Carbonic anhydrase n=1 Tax=Wenzhouxiangella marina TaxID=1579979 RepID=A0A0K0Y0A8_9GAMM|nr:gamma carbonic anhydrase family protein [Wenzhouxiangella marina]AKS43322.1 carbonic anhydrase [Wenzhouxiangella marina]MBB6088563.1 carbonic anhydrase/acetyltransferase-like protein (isoleucine patch superfamily) [Wenzhouxiangella marina]
MDTNDLIRSFDGRHPELGNGVWIDPAATVIGEVRLGDDVSIWPGTVLRGDVNRIEVGARSNIQDGTIAHVTHDGPHSPGGLPLILGEDITVGHGAILHACTIGDRCLIGMGALVLDGAVIEADVMLAAGSLVSPGKRLESGWLYRGRPVEAVRRLSEKELEMLRYSAAHYVRLKNRYLSEAGQA